MDLKKKLNLKQTIEQFRLCKSKKEENQFILKHKAYIRINIKEQNNIEKVDSFLKLIWMNMWGYETDFSQIECMNIWFKDDFYLKVIGYMAISINYSNKSEVTMMITNRIHRDLSETDNDFVIALAIKAFSYLADENMVDQLYPLIKKIIFGNSKFNKKKAIMCLITVIKIKESYIQAIIDDIIISCIVDKNHGVLICLFSLIKEILKTDKKVNLLKSIMPFYKNLSCFLIELSSKVKENYDFKGINDPFLQSFLINILKELTIYNEENLSEFSQTLTTIYNNISPKNNTPINSILYEISKTIMEIETIHGLKKIAINIMGNFLNINNTDYKFVSLVMLYNISKKYPNEVSKFQYLIQDCIKKDDYSIKKISLEILKLIASKDTVEDVLLKIYEEINKSKDINFQNECLNKLLFIIKKNAVSKIWYVQNIIKACENFYIEIKEELLNDFYEIIFENKSIQIYSILRLLNNIYNKKINLNIIKLCFIIFGTFGSNLIINKNNNLILNIDSIIEILLIFNLKKLNIISKKNCLYSMIKLYYKTTFKNDIINYLNLYLYDKDLGDKISELLNFINSDKELFMELIQPIPYKDNKNRYLCELKLGEIQLSEFDYLNNIFLKQNNNEVEEVDIINIDKTNNNDNTNILDFDLIGDTNNDGNNNNLLDINIDINNDNNIDLLNFGNINDNDNLIKNNEIDIIDINTDTKQSSNQNLNNFDLLNFNQDNLLKIEKEIYKDNQIIVNIFGTKNSTSNLINYKMSIFNDSDLIINNCIIKIAVQKHLNLELKPLDITKIEVKNSINQDFIINYNENNNIAIKVQMVLSYLDSDDKEINFISKELMPN